VPDHSGKKRGSVSTDDPSSSKSRPILNEKAVPAWTIPSGKYYDEIFQARSENLKHFPTFHVDGKKKPLCVEFQSKSQCTSACTLSHPNPLNMDCGDWIKVNQRFLDVYGTAA
jgi:hypothetical protein